MRRLGIVDLGSNTARLVVFLYEPGKWFRILDGIREPVRLGEGIGLRGELTPEAIDRAEAALRLFFDYARSTDLDHFEVIGTSALRDARNAAVFLRRVASLDLDLSILAGEQEARLGVTAVANSFPFENAWVTDLGGGSAQISQMRGRLFRGGEAFPLGTIRLREAHIRSDPPKMREVRALEAAVAAGLGDLAAEIRHRDWPLVAIGGTVRNLARASQERNDDPLGILHGFEFTLDALEEMIDLLLAQTEAERAEVPGLNPDRADLILPGALLFRWLLRATGRDRVVISGQGVREGAFYHRFLPTPHLLGDVRRFSVLNLQRQWQQRIPHVSRVVALARQLFDGLRPLHKLGNDAWEILEAAAELHDIGMAVDYHRHHKHGAYLARSVAIPGFSNREQALIALLVRFHRKGVPRLGRYRRLALPGDLRLMLQLAACLRLAEQLERSRAGRVTDIAVEVAPRRVTVRSLASEPPTVELWEAAKHRSLFERAFRRPLRLQATMASGVS